MSNQPDQSLINSENKDPNASNHIDIGALLIEARNNLSLTVTDIATQLNLPQSTIEQLENNQFTESLPLAFIRGYVISYATKVGLDITMIKQAFDKQMGEAKVSLRRVESLSIFEKNRYNFNSKNTSIKLISLLIILVIVFFAGRAGWKKYQSIVVEDGVQLEEHDLSLSTKEIPLDIETASKNNRLNQIENISIENDDKTNGEKATTSSIETSQSDTSELIQDDIEEPIKPLEAKITETTQTPEFLTSVEEITLSFSNDCWVQIIDASGNELAFGIKKPGKVMVLQGVAPILLILGDPSVVDLDFKGNRVDLSQYPEKRRAEITLQ